MTASVTIKSDFNDEERKVWEQSMSDMFVQWGYQLDLKDLDFECGEPKKTYHYGKYRDTTLELYDDYAIVTTNIPTYHMFIGKEQIDLAFKMAKIRSQRDNEICRAMGG